MVGLSILLESQEGINKKTPQVINKINTLVKPSPPRSISSSIPSSSSSSSSRRSVLLQETPTFLQQCFLCTQKLLPGKDIYMYKGDRGFCSVECRCRQIFMDEEEVSKKDNSSLAATSATSRSRKGARNRSNGMVY